MNTQTRVGIFVSAGIIGFCILVTLLGGEVAIFKSYAYVYAELEQVQGLTRGSVVSLSGMNIGNIEKISFSTEKKTLILKLRIQPEYLKRIKTDSVADVRTQGALGDRYIFISAGEESSPSLKDGDTVQTTKSKDFLDMLSGKASSAEKAFEIVDEVYKIVKSMNSENRMDRLMSNLVESSTDLKLTASEGRKMMTDLRGSSSDKVQDAIKRLDSILAKIDRGDGSLGALINDPSVHDRLKAMLGTDSHKQAIQSLIRDSIKSDKSP
jgi:phospholipid/cholesterol/gamma-HCH transport system substrate-binding protein